MDVKKGDRTFTIPGLVVAVGIITIGGIVTDICKTISGKLK